MHVKLKLKKSIVFSDSCDCWSLCDDPPTHPSATAVSEAFKSNTSEIVANTNKILPNDRLNSKLNTNQRNQQQSNSLKADAYSNVNQTGGLNKNKHNNSSINLGPASYQTSSAKGKYNTTTISSGKQAVKNNYLKKKSVSSSLENISMSDMTKSSNNTNNINLQNALLPEIAFKTNDKDSSKKRLSKTKPILDSNQNSFDIGHDEHRFAASAAQCAHKSNHNVDRGSLAQSFNKAGEQVVEFFHARQANSQDPVQQWSSQHG